MHKHAYRALATMLIAVLLLALFPVGYAKAGTGLSYKETLSKTTNFIEKESVTLVVEITSNPGLAGYLFVVKYNTDVFEFVSATKGTLTDDPDGDPDSGDELSLTTTANGNTPGEVRLVGLCQDGLDVHATGVVSKITLKVKEGFGVTAGDELAKTVADPENTVTASGDTLEKPGSSGLVDDTKVAGGNGSSDIATTTEGTPKSVEKTLTEWFNNSAWGGSKTETSASYVSKIASAIGLTNDTTTYSASAIATASEGKSLSLVSTDIPQGYPTNIALLKGLTTLMIDFGNTGTQPTNANGAYAHDIATLSSELPNLTKLSIENSYGPNLAIQGEKLETLVIDGTNGSTNIGALTKANLPALKNLTLNNTSLDVTKDSAEPLVLLTRDFGAVLTLTTDLAWPITVAEVANDGVLTGGKTEPDLYIGTTKLTSAEYSIEIFENSGTPSSTSKGVIGSLATIPPAPTVSANYLAKIKGVPSFLGGTVGTTAVPEDDLNTSDTWVINLLAIPVGAKTFTEWFNDPAWAGQKDPKGFAYSTTVEYVTKIAALFGCVPSDVITQEALKAKTGPLQIDGKDIPNGYPTNIGLLVGLEELIIDNAGTAAVSASGKAFEDIATLVAQLPNMIRLVVNSANVASDLSLVSEKLEELDLQGNKVVQFSGLQVSDVPALKKLDLRANPIKNAAEVLAFDIANSTKIELKVDPLDISALPTGGTPPTSKATERNVKKTITTYDGTGASSATLAQTAYIVACGDPGEVAYGEQILRKDIDYTVTPSITTPPSGDTAGKVSYKVEGIGLFSGSFTFECDVYLASAKKITFNDLFNKTGWTAVYDGGTKGFVTSDAYVGAIAALYLVEGKPATADTLIPVTAVEDVVAWLADNDNLTDAAKASPKLELKGSDIPNGYPENIAYLKSFLTELTVEYGTGTVNWTLQDLTNIASNLPNLKKLTITGGGKGTGNTVTTGKTDRGLQNLAFALDYLEELNLSGNNIENLRELILEDVPALKKLDLTNNSIQVAMDSSVYAVNIREALIKRGADEADIKFDQGIFPLSFDSSSDVLSTVQVGIEGLVTKTFAGSAVTQSITLTIGSGTETAVLVEGRDYTLTYKNNTAAGKATVTITGIGIFTGEESFDFIIDPSTTPPTPPAKQVEITVTVKVGGLTISATIRIFNSAGQEIFPDADGDYPLIEGQTYRYEISQPGFKTATGYFVASSTNPDIVVTLVASSSGSTGDNGWYVEPGTPSSGSSSTSSTSSSSSSSTITTTPAKKDLAETLAGDYLYKMGLFKGVGLNDDGTPKFSLTRSLTRYEALVIVIRLLGLEEQALAYTESSPFEDTNKDQEKYVAFAYNVGYNGTRLANGTTATKFNPNGQVSFKQFVVFLLRALGYSDLTGDFAYNDAVSFAENLGAFKTFGKADSTATQCLRSDAVVAMSNFLMTGVKEDGVKLIDKLAKLGVVTEAQARDFAAFAAAYK